MSTKHARTERRRRLPLGWIVLAAVGLFAVVVMAMSLGEKAEETGDPAVSGEPLPAHGAGADAAIGMPAPRVVGADFTGERVVIEPGVPTAIVFLAHWCPHCQAEVPAVTEWLRATGGVDGTQVLSVVTSVDDLRDNYPPSAWLEREEWPVPVLLDDADDSVFAAFGGSGFPFWVFVDAEGLVALRAAGSVPMDGLERALGTLSD